MKRALELAARLESALDERLVLLARRAIRREVPGALRLEAGRAAVTAVVAQKAVEVPLEVIRGALGVRTEEIPVVRAHVARYIVESRTSHTAKRKSQYCAQNLRPSWRELEY